MTIILNIEIKIKDIYLFIYIFIRNLVYFIIYQIR